MCFRAVANQNLTVTQHSLNSDGDMPLDDPFVKQLINGSLLDVWDDADVWKVKGNLGVISILFDNPLYKRSLFDVGLRPEDAFGCALDYLFVPSSAVRTYFAREFNVMTSSLLKVGIQARFGDSNLRGGNEGAYAEASLPSVQHFFDCAQHLLAMYQQPEQGGIMLLVSDSLDVRLQASEVYGERLMTKLDEPGHTQLTRGNHQRQAMIHAAGEHWLFGMADYHIISSIGNFGKSAALRSRQWHSVYSLSVAGGNGIACDGRNALDFGELVRMAPYV